MERRLSAIFAADMVGYSRLMEADEIDTIERQKAHRRELIDPVFDKFHGRIIKTTGDGLLAEFVSVVEAVQCAINIQRVMPERESEAPDDRRIQYRIGINLGDVVFEDGDVHGDGVNVASRLEQMAKPGGICISGTTFDQIDGRSSFYCAFLGEQNLKNISRPVRAYDVAVTSDGIAQNPSASLALPDKPSIAVLPFDNMSGDPEQEFLSDGITEDIITALSRISWIFVISRNSTFTYKGRPVDVKKAGRELGVRYMLEGSVRKSDKRVRVTAQLIVTESGNHIWAKRHDRNLVDVFDLQDDLTEAICGELDAELATRERQVAHAKPPTDLKSWELFQRGMSCFYKFGRDDMAAARQYFEQAADRSSNFARALAGLAYVAWAEVNLAYANDLSAAVRQGVMHGERALALDDRDDFVHYALGRICMLAGDSERAIPELEKSIDLNPNFAASYNALGQTLYWFGRAREAIPLFDRAIRLSPHDPILWGFYSNRGLAHFFTDEIDQAIADVKSAISEKGDEFLPHTNLAVFYGEIGQFDKAASARQRSQEVRPNVSIAMLQSIAQAMYRPYFDRYAEGMLKAGFPEE